MTADLLTVRNRRPRLSAGQMLARLTVAGVVALAGCDGSPKNKGTAVDATAAKTATVDDQCANVVSSIFDTFQLQRLGQTTTVADGVLRLNDWQQSCQSEAPSAATLPEPLRKLLGDEQLEALKSPRFTNRDGEHLRDGVLFRSMVKYAFEANAGDATELQRVVAAFQFVVRSLELIDKHPGEIPLTPYEILLLGKGTVADRAWVFARLLQENRIDAVLIAPANPRGEGAASLESYLVGVILEGRTHLFDPRAGVPIPPPGAAASAKAARGAATLEQAAIDPAVLRQLDVDEEHPYPFKADDLKNPTVYLITDFAFSTDRMRSLQGQFSGEQSMVLADPLPDTTDGPGVWSRVTKAGGKQWSEDSLRIWTYPESQANAHASMNDDQRKILDRLLLPFSAYASPRFDPREQKWVLSAQEQVDDRAAGEFDPGKSKRTRTTKGAQMRARLTHVGGDFAKGVTDYFDVWQRSRYLVQAVFQSKIEVENDKLALHVRAVDDSSFWTAVCKFEQRNYRVAIDSLLRYRTQNPKGAWTRQCRYLLALCLAAQEDYQAAVEELDAVEPGDPEYFGYQWLIRQWQMAEPEVDPQAENTPKAGE